MHLSARTAVVLATAALLGACSAMNPFTRIDGSDPQALSRMNGSWTVINTGGTAVEGLNPPATIVFDTRSRSVSGFDGCNDFRGTYAFDRGALKAMVRSTRRACASDMARAVSARIGNLFADGAEVVDMSVMGASVLMLRNSSGDVRMGPTSALQNK